MLPKILKLANYRRLYFAGATSELGSFITDTALMLFIFRITNQQNSSLGYLKSTFLIFLVTGIIFGGPIGERFNRKKVLILCEVFRAPLVLLLATTTNPFFIVLLSGMIAFFTGIFRPSRQALMNELVPPEKMKAANGLFGSTIAILHLLGPLVGAYAFSFFNGAKEILAFDLLTYIFGIILLLRINYSDKHIQKPEGNLLKELQNGIKFVQKRRDLKSILLNSFVAGLSIGILIPLLLPFTIEFLGKGEKEYGILLGIFGLGGFLGGTLSEKFGKDIAPGKIACLTLLLEPFLFVIWINVHYWILSAIILFFWGIVVFVRITSQLNHVSENVETKQLSNVHSMLELSFLLPNILGALLIGITGGFLTTMEFLIFSSVMFFITTYPRLFLKEFQLLLNYKGQQVNRETYIE
ncbi:MFS transporter [Bacteriovoracaceae bacterium]|nr:MFS transporter [Bacteriovoracaceae bacterium]